MKSPPHCQSVIRLATYVEAFSGSSLRRWSAMAPWELTGHCVQVVGELLGALVVTEYSVTGDIAVHRSATVETGAILKGPLIIGPRCFVAHGAYLRGGNWIDECCSIGPGSELKSSYVFAGSRIAHFNFVGDSIIGSDVNIEAGAILCNYRNERENKEIRVRVDGRFEPTGCDKFGALVGDVSRIGANAVLAPGSLLARGTVVGRASLHDQDPTA